MRVSQFNQAIGLGGLTGAAGRRSDYNEQMSDKALSKSSATMDLFAILSRSLEDCSKSLNRLEERVAPIMESVPGQDAPSQPAPPEPNFALGRAVHAAAMQVDSLHYRIECLISRCQL